MAEGEGEVLRGGVWQRVVNVIATKERKLEDLAPFVFNHLAPSPSNSHSSSQGERSFPS